MLIKYSGKYVKIYFDMKITFPYIFNQRNISNFLMNLEFVPTEYLPAE